MIIAAPTASAPSKGGAAVRATNRGLAWPSRPQQGGRLEAQLNDILEAVSKVSELDLSDVPPTAHPLEIQNAWDEDVPRPCLTAAHTHGFAR